MTPKYLHVSCMVRFCIERCFLSLDDVMSMVLLFGLVLMKGIPLDVKSHWMRYHAHLESSSAPPDVCIICSQLLAAVWRLLHIVISELFVQSFAYCRLSSTRPMM